MVFRQERQGADFWGRTFYQNNLTRRYPMKTTYLLIDFENLSKIDLSDVPSDFKVKLFLGEQSKIKADYINKILKNGNTIELIKIKGNGPNAVDFHISFYIGVLSEKEKDASFIIYSKDTGFDPLQKHLKEMNIDCERKETLAKTLKIEQPPAIFMRCEELLKKDTKSRPASVKKLESYLLQRTKPDFKEFDFNAILEYLKKNDKITMDDKGKLKYSL